MKKIAWLSTFDNTLFELDIVTSYSQLHDFLFRLLGLEPLTDAERAELKRKAVKW